MRRIVKNIIVAGLCLGMIFSTGVGAFAATSETELEMTNAGTSSIETRIISGQTNFDNPYVYHDSEYVTYTCFTLESNGTKYYAAVKDNQYWYYQDAFKGKSLTLEGSYLGVAKDGTSTIRVIKLVEGDKKTNLDEYLWQFYKGTPQNPNFVAFRDLYSAGMYMKVSDDGTYAEFDTNPLNADDDSTLASLDAIIAMPKLADLNKALGLPDWLYNEMGTTRAIDGKQREEFDHIIVTWTYHPDKGIEATYRIK